MESNNICTQIQTSLDAFHDKELETSEYNKVAAHVESCHTCSKQLTEIQALTGALQRLPRQPAPAHLSNRINALIDAQTASRRRAVKPWIPAAAAAAVVLAIIGAGKFIPTSDNTKIAKSPATPPSHSKPIAENHGQITTHMTGSSTTSPAIIAPVEKMEVAQAPRKASGTSKIDQSENKSTVNNKADTVLSKGTDYLAELPTFSNSFTDAIGLATDEDGLYDLKM